MYVRKFQGESIDETIKLIKKELGPEAIILKTETFKGIKSAFKKSRVEITAAITEKSLAKKQNVERALPEEKREVMYSSPSSYLSEVIDDYDQKNARVGTGYGNVSLNRAVQSKTVESTNVVNELVHSTGNDLDNFLKDDEKNKTDSNDLNDFLSDSTSKKNDNEVLKMPDNGVHPESLKENGLSNPVVSTNISQETSNLIEEMKERLTNLEKNTANAEFLEKVLELETQISKINFVKSTKNDDLQKITKLLQNSGVSDEFIGKELLMKYGGDNENNDLDLITFCLNAFEKHIHIDTPIKRKLPRTFVHLSVPGSGQSSLIRKIQKHYGQGEVLSLTTSDEIRTSSSADKLLGIKHTRFTDSARLFSAARKVIAEGIDVHIDLSFTDENTNNFFQLLNLLKGSVGNFETMITLSARFSERYNQRLLSKFSDYLDYINFSYFDETLEYGSLFNVLYKNPNAKLAFVSTGEVIPHDVEIATKELLIEKVFNV